jgi:hypothetical protein
LIGMMVKDIRKNYYGMKMVSREEYEAQSFFPPPWNISDHPEKTLEWVEFQKALRKDPHYYFGLDPSLRNFLMRNEDGSYPPLNPYIEEK